MFYINVTVRVTINGYQVSTRTKTSIRYAKENDRKEREKERKKGRRRDIEREGEIREIERERDREVKGIER